MRTCINVYHIEVQVLYLSSSNDNILHLAFFSFFKSKASHFCLGCGPRAILGG